MEKNLPKNFEIIPAIDLLDGKCVRLLRGDFAAKKIYEKNPAKIAAQFFTAGARRIHLVDLNGAKNGAPENAQKILEIRQKFPNLKIQIGGGIREISTAEFYFKNGIDKIIVGTAAVENENFLQNLVAKFTAEKIIVGVDLRGEKIATDGWKKNSEISLEKFLTKLKNLKIAEIVATDISRDGTLGEPNFELYEKLRKMNFEIIASGGVSDFSNLQKLKKLGARGAIVGKAIYENKIDLKKSLQKLSPNFLTKRIVPCLDVKNGRTVKGVNFENLRDAGDPVELAKKYAADGADELVFLDISATAENRGILENLVKKVAREIFIPFTVGGGLKSVDEIQKILRAGADKVSINSAAVKNPDLISRAAEIFGSQAIVAAIDAKKVGKIWKVFVAGGKIETNLNAVKWARELAKRGAGEILLTSMDRDGTNAGYDLELLKKISNAVQIPIIASGGAGNLQNLKDAFSAGADAVLAASIFHFGKYSIADAKNFLAEKEIAVRI